MEGDKEKRGAQGKEMNEMTKKPFDDRRRSLVAKARAVRDWIKRWWAVLLVCGVFLNLISSIGFNLFLYEESGQAVGFSGFAYEKAEAWADLERAAGLFDQINAQGKAYTRYLGWLNPLQYPGYRAWFSIGAKEWARAMHVLAKTKLGEAAIALEEEQDEAYDHLDGDQVPYFQAKDFVGQELTVVFKVTKAQESPSGKAFFLNSPGEFSAVAFNKALWPALRILSGERIGVRGKIQLYKGKPEIVIESLNQIESSRLSDYLMQLDAENRGERGD
jgi:hypothetical protein